MPTGYTADIESGKEKSLKTFLTKASRGMGLYIMQREDSLDAPPAKREVSPWYEESVTRDRERLAELQNMTEEDKAAGFEKAVTSVRKSRQESIDSNEEKRRNYQRFIDAFNEIEWPNDPTDEAYQFFVGFKKFVGEQLQESYDFDVHDDPGKWYKEPVNVDKWYSNEVEHAKKSLASSEKYLAEERERVRSQNYIHDRFMEFLEGLD